MVDINFHKMLSLYGKWEVLEEGKILRYSSSDDSDASHGLILLPKDIEDGIIECTIKLPITEDHKFGAFIIFRAEGGKNYYAAGVGGWDSAYTLFEGRNLSSTRVAHAGAISNLISDRNYRIRIALDGQRVQVSVDGVKVIDYDRLTNTGTGTTAGTGIGIFTFRGTSEAIFGPMAVDDRRPNAFIAMQFSEPYNEVYRDAIQPFVEEIGYEPMRVDDISRPGIVLNDIWNQLTESSVVIAEVTEANPNVYYEIGAAHSLKKPTILLAQRGTKLPFDIGPHRCIFYDNTIPGRAKLLESLKSSLTSVLGISNRNA
jgi:hypothetical protein